MLLHRWRDNVSRKGAAQTPLMRVRETAGLFLKTGGHAMSRLGDTKRVKRLLFKVRYNATLTGVRLFNKMMISASSLNFLFSV